MEQFLFLVGLSLGIIVSLPVGPVNILCIERAVAAGFVSGFAVGLGGVGADAFFAAAALFGLGTVKGLVDDHQGVIAATGGFILILFGLATWLKRVARQCDKPAPLDALHALMSGFAVTITNPGVLFGFLALYSGLGDWGPAEGDVSQALSLLAGTLTGALIWWAIVSALVVRYRDRLNARWLFWMNRIAGLVLLGFGLALLLQAASRALLST